MFVVILLTHDRSLQFQHQRGGSGCTGFLSLPIVSCAHRHRQYLPFNQIALWLQLTQSLPVVWSRWWPCSCLRGQSGIMQQFIFFLRWSLPAHCRERTWKNFQMVASSVRLFSSLFHKKFYFRVNPNLFVVVSPCCGSPMVD